MQQYFEVFQGLPEDLVIRMLALKALGRSSITVIPTDVAAKYVIISSGA